MGFIKIASLILMAVLASQVSEGIGNRVKCFCNSGRCPLGTCTSKFGCFIKIDKLARTKQEPNSTLSNTTTVAYGCVEDFKSKWCLIQRKGKRQKQTPPMTLCCADKDLCNMPLQLKELMRNHENERLLKSSHHPRQPKIKKSCGELVPALRLASVIIPSILIALVCFIALALSCELVRYRRLYASVKYLKHSRQNTNKSTAVTLDSESSSSTVCEYMNTCCSTGQELNSSCLTTEWKHLIPEKSTSI